LLERCRLDRLTRNQHVLFRLGECIAFAEGAAVFAERVVTHPTKAINLSRPLLEVMARVFAREAVQKVVCEGARWAAGAGQTDPEFWKTMRLPEAMAAQAGLVEDMDVVARGLMEAFPA
jgi:hypothetical protein